MKNEQSDDDSTMNKVKPPLLVYYNGEWSSDDDDGSDDDSLALMPPLLQHTDDDSINDDTNNGDYKKELPLPLKGRSWGSLCKSDVDKNKVYPNEVYYKLEKEYDNKLTSDSSNIGTIHDLGDTE